MYEFKAAVLDRKLNLIDENKNLLQYPYKYTELPTGLENAGDGSILTTAENIPEGNSSLIYLENTLSLPAGDYTASIEVSDIIDITTPITEHGFSITLKTDTRDDISISDHAVFNVPSDIPENIPVKVYLKVPADFTAGLVIKPMVEKGLEKTNWVPYMKTIGSYVDERFNSTNTKLRDVLAFMKLVDVDDV